MKYSYITLLVAAFLILPVSCAQKDNEFSTLQCGDIQGFHKLIEHGSVQIYVFGEVHGTKEAPAFVGDVVCNMLRSGRPVVLALEYSDNYFADIVTYLAEENEDKATKQLLSTSYWIGGNQDGKRSKAMFGLIQKVKHYNTESNQFHLAAFDMDLNSHTRLTKEKSSMENYSLVREREMAENVMRIANEYPKHKIIVFTGNWHAKRRTSKNGNSPESLAAHLPKDRYLSFNMNTQPGSHWTWGRGKVTSPFRVDKNFISNGLPLENFALHIFKTSQEQYDGLFYTVTQTVSYPTSHEVK